MSMLGEMETAEDVRIIYACESGSRAWGFPSVDSDYDVRFIYVLSTNAYLSIEDRKDVIEKPIKQGLDINGWDLRKALQLLRKSNPPLLEWLGSPIVYLEKYTVAERMRSLARTHFSPAACFYHYLHMARRSREAYDKDGPIPLKRYFYVLRPLLALEWIDRGLGIAPTDFNVLVDRLVEDPAMKRDISILLDTKRKGDESTCTRPVASIGEFIDGALSKWEQRGASLPQNTPPLKQFDHVFRDCLEEVWRG